VSQCDLETSIVRRPALYELLRHGKGKLYVGSDCLRKITYLPIHINLRNIIRNIHLYFRTVLVAGKEVNIELNTEQTVCRCIYCEYYTKKGS